MINKEGCISLKIDVVFAYSAKPDVMQHSAAFHLGFHCLHKNPLRSFRSKKGLSSKFCEFRMLRDLSYN